MDFKIVDDAILAGKLWRAKEIMQGRLGSSGYSPALYEKYGQVLLLMGDLIEAGKYLFISGQRESGYSVAIELFLARNAKQGWARLKSAFPRRVRNLPIDEFPEQVQLELSNLGYKEEHPAPIHHPRVFVQVMKWLSKLRTLQ